jgi:hypothetical protein
MSAITSTTPVDSKQCGHPLHAGIFSSGLKPNTDSNISALVSGAFAASHCSIIVIAQSRFSISVCGSEVEDLIGLEDLIESSLSQKCSFSQASSSAPDFS